ncbi:MAG TPA: hypothetical protein VMU38_03820 [Candidatus Binatia bacterium]|nr:hypothetical protein [Candidatus Binatia bacterium]
MFLNPDLGAALDRIVERAGDVRRAYISGAVPAHDDVATASSASDFTLDPLAVTPPEGAYFVTTDERGRTAYTRDGSFALRNGGLVDSSGQPIFGRTSPGGPLEALRIDAVDRALGRASEAAVEPDGSLVYRRYAVDPRTGAREAQRIVAGRVALARFPAGTRLESSDGSHASPPAGLVPEEGFPGDGRFARIAPMRRERSRIDLDESLARLKDAYLAFDALRAAEMAKSHTGKTAMDLLK